MTWNRTLKAMAAFLVLVALHYTLRPLLAWRVSIDFLTIAVLLMAVRLRPGGAALVGFITGIIADALLPSAFGAGALAMTAIGFGASFLKAAFFADNVILHASFFFVGKWAYDAVYVLAARQSSAWDVAVQLAVWSPLAALLTAVAGVATIMVFRMSLEPHRI